MKKSYVMGLAALLAAPMAFAGSMPTGSIAGYVTSTSVDLGGGIDDSATGFGIKGWGSVSGPWFVHGEYESASLEFDTPLGTVDSDLNELRLGGGMVGEMSPGTMWLAKAEYIDFGSDADEAGFGVHGGLMFGTNAALSGFATLGYLSTDNTDGLEFDVGGKYSFTKEIAGFLDYRSYMGSADGGGDFDVGDIRLGAAYSFY
jgi:hypothetical protein